MRLVSETAGTNHITFSNMMKNTVSREKQLSGWPESAWEACAPVTAFPFVFLQGVLLESIHIFQES